MDSARLLAGVLQSARVRQFTIQKEAQEGAYHGNDGETPQFVPRGLERAVDQVRGQLECEAGHEPTRKHQPDVTAVLVRGPGADQDTQDADHRLDGPSCNDDDRDHLDAKSDVVSEMMQHFFHGRSSTRGRVRYAAKP